MRVYFYFSVKTKIEGTGTVRVKRKKKKKKNNKHLNSSWAHYTIISSTLGFDLTSYTSTPGGASKKHFVFPMQLSQRTWRAKAFRLTRGANLSNSFRHSWIASAFSVFAHFFYLGKFEFDKAVAQPSGDSHATFFVTLGPRASRFVMEISVHTQALNHSVMVMMDRCRNLCHWVIGEGGRLASANAGGALGLSYSKARLKDPRSPSAEARKEV